MSSGISAQCTRHGPEKLTFFVRQEGDGVVKDPAELTLFFKICGEFVTEEERDGILEFLEVPAIGEDGSHLCFE